MEDFSRKILKCGIAWKACLNMEGQRTLEGNVVAAELNLTRGTTAMASEH